MKLFSWFKKEAIAISQQGSAFVRHSVHAAEVTEAKARVAAINELITLAAPVLDALEHDAARVHAAQDALEARRKAILATL